MKKIICTVLLLTFSTLTNAFELCGVVPVKLVTIQADRESGANWANTMRFHIAGSNCAGIDYAYLKNDHPAYSSILSTLLSAHARGQGVDLAVKSTEGLRSNAREIEWITLP